MINIATILKHNVIGKLFNHAIVFLVNIFIVRLLGASVSGFYFNELYLLNFFVFIFSAGLDYAAIAWLSREPALLPVIHRLLLKTFLFFVLAVLLYVLVIMPVFNNTFNQPAIAIVLFSSGNLLLIFFQGILSSLKKFNLQNVILSTTNIIFLLYLLFFINNNTPGILHHVATVYALVLFIQGLIMFAVSYKKDTGTNYSINPIPFFRYGIFIMFSSIVYFAFLRIDNFFVEKYSTPVVLGNYVQCGKIGQYFLYFSSIISSTLLPFISAETAGASYSEWKKLMRPYIMLICFGAVIIALTGKTIFPLLFGNEFNEMYVFMIILLPGFVCLGILTLVNAIYIGKGKINKIFKGDLLGLLIVSSLDGLLVPYYGAIAAATISSVAYCLVFIYLWWGFKKQFPLP